MEPKTVMHCLINCSKSAKNWQGLGVQFIPGTFLEVWDWWIEVTMKARGGYHHKSLIAVTLWKIWLAQNLKIFEQRDITPKQIISSSKSLMEEFLPLVPS
ncbi:hypothetical protein AHAS_Ahas19G0264300 [Arachis hypogaea]